MGVESNRGGRRLRRDGAQAAGRYAAKKVKRSFVLSPEASRRLDAHALGTGLDASAIVADLIDRHCRRFVLQDRGGAAQEPAGGEGQGGGQPE